MIAIRTWVLRRASNLRAPARAAPTQPVFPLQQPDLAQILATHEAEGNLVDEAGALALLDAGRTMIALGVAEPQEGPAQVTQGVVGDAVGCLAHQASPVKFRIEPEAAAIPRRLVGRPD